MVLYHLRPSRLSRPKTDRYSTLYGHFRGASISISLIFPEEAMLDGKLEMVVNEADIWLFEWMIVIFTTIIILITSSLFFFFFLIAFLRCILVGCSYPSTALATRSRLSSQDS